MFVQFFVFYFLLRASVCISDRMLKAAQNSSKKVKNHSLVGKISYSHETVTTRQEVSCREYTVGTKQGVLLVSWALCGRLGGEGCI